MDVGRQAVVSVTAKVRLAQELGPKAADELTVAIKASEVMIAK